MRRTAPWHSPSECSFRYGYRIGLLAGKIQGVKFGLQKAGDDCRKEIARLEKKRKAWKAGRPK